MWRARVGRKAVFSLAVGGAVLGACDTARAGGFAVREQSAYFQGSSFAGNAAGGALSSMFWNPAAAGQLNGINTESAYSLILPDSEITADPASTFIGLGASSGDIGKDAFVPSSYLSYQLSTSLVFGFSLNAPFGLATEPSNNTWAGQTHARTSKITTYNAQPVLAYRVNPTLIVAAGLQIEYMEGILKSATQPVAGAPNAVVKGDDVAVGFTAGVLWQPAPGTSVGLGFRSSIDHTLDGSFKVAGVPGSADIEADLATPETVTLSLRQALTPRLTGLATVEWSNWSRLDELVVDGAGITLPLGWHDGWFFALGAEYAWSPDLTLRGGLAYEISPIQNPDERPARVPDADRVWASVGASYQWSRNVSLELAYSHVFVEDAAINRADGLGLLVADAETDIDILSVGLKVKWGGEMLEALK